MTLQTATQIISINILIDISKNKDNQIMKAGYLIEYNVRNTLFSMVHSQV